MERFGWRNSSPSPQPFAPGPLEREKLFCIDLLANCPVNYSTAERFSKKKRLCSAECLARAKLN
jgi:hypothetical protein